MKHREASIALRRFGLGPRRGDLQQVAADPRGYVLAALQHRSAAFVTDPALEPSHLSFEALRSAQRAQREARRKLPGLRSNEGPVGSGAGPGDMRSAEKSPVAPGARGAAASTPLEVMPPMEMPAEKGAAAGAGGVVRPGEIRREVFREEARARLDHAVASTQPFLERLVYFWSNHFCISGLKGQMVRVLAGSFEREAIRPHVLGRFWDMLKAVEQHPAMLVYLDNAQSVGPGSPVGRKRGRGLNENLAREILELHTLGVAGGYSQPDVTSLANVLTGWTIAEPQLAANAAANPRLAARLGGGEIVPGRFVFTPDRHEPGPRVVLGKRYDDRGLATGEAVLADLARHPATARQIARKLARHFVADNPPPALVARLEATFRSTDGDLAELARALATAPECWAAPPRKVVPPFDFVVSLMRAFELRLRAPEAVRIAAAIGQPLWAPPSPKGWPDDDDAWMAPSAVRERLRIAERAARLMDRGADPRAAASDLFGDALSRQTMLAVERAEVREQGFELLMMSPEFLRR